MMKTTPYAGSEAECQLGIPSFSMLNTYKRLKFQLSCRFRKS